MGRWGTVAPPVPDRETPAEEVGLAGALSIYCERFPKHFELCVHLGYAQLKIDNQSLSDGDDHALADCGFESLKADGNLVGRGREIGKPVIARFSADRGSLQTGC